MTLKEWLTAWPFAPTGKVGSMAQVAGETWPLYVADTAQPEMADLRRAAWRLSDARVESVVGGSILFAPKADNGPR